MVKPSGMMSGGYAVGICYCVVIAVVLVEVESNCFIRYRCAAAGFQRGGHGRISAVRAGGRRNRKRCPGLRANRDVAVDRIVRRIRINRGFVADVCRVADDGPVGQSAFCRRVQQDGARFIEAQVRERN